MNYGKQYIQLDNPLQFWNHFEGEERVFWVDRQSDRIVVGARRLATIHTEEEREQYAYLFYGGTFFDEPCESGHWAHMGQEIIAFTHYYIEENGESFYLYAGEPETIERTPITMVNHDIREVSDDYDDFARLVNAIQQEIAKGTVNKVVASREADFVCNKPYQVDSILARLVENNPGCFIFAYEKEGRTFLGASPEIIVRHRGPEILSYALAGTFAKNEHTKDALLQDPKNRHEHNIVINSIAQMMQTVTNRIIIGDTGIMELPHLYHLLTILTAHDDSLSLVEWGRLLHPTPAMGGNPKNAAMAIIKEHETHNRGMYAAPFGFMKDMGDGILVAAIRSALIIGNHMYAYAGCGIVEQSVVDEEYEETRNKMRTVLEAVHYE